MTMIEENNRKIGSYTNFPNGYAYISRYYILQLRFYEPEQDYSILC